MALVNLKQTAAISTARTIPVVSVASSKPISESLINAKKIDTGVTLVPGVNRGVISIAVAESKAEEAEVEQKQSETEREKEFIQSMQDGSYFVGEEDETTPGTAVVTTEVSAEEQEAGDGVSEVEIISGMPEAEPQSAPSREPEVVAKETAKQKFEKVMDWLTADQMRLTVVLTVFCMVCWVVVKMVKK